MSLDNKKIITVNEYNEIPIIANNLIDVSTGKLLVYKEVLEKDLVRISRQKDKLTFKAGSLIGLIPINDNIIINIIPRVPVHNIEHLLQIANAIPQKISSSLRSYQSHEIFINTLFDEIVKNVLDYVNLLINIGIHHNYSEVINDSSFPKGKILLNSTVEKYINRGNSYTIRSSFFSRTKDTDLNRIVKLCLWILFKKCQYNLTKNSSYLSSKIQQLLYYFSDVKLIPLSEKHTLVSKPIYIPDTHSYYSDAIKVFIMIIQGRGLAFNNIDGELKFSSFLWRMDDIFESYILKTLQTAAITLNKNLQVLDGNKSSSDGGSKPLYTSPSSETTAIYAKPDIVINRLGISTSAKVNSLIIDVKYKEKGAERDAINQIVTYGVSYNCNNVAVISLAKSGDYSELKFLGKIGNINVYHYSFQLSSTNLLKEENILASSIFSIL